MKTILISDIKIPPHRQRKTFDDEHLKELKDSILTYGLFHAILLSPDEQTLIAGESRLRALKTLPEFQIKYNGQDCPLNQIPFSVTHKTDPISIFEIELHENIKRRDLPWQERAIAEATLHQLRSEEHGTYDPRSNPEGWSLRKTAKELNPNADGGQPVKSLQENLALAEALDDPEIAKIKDRKAALKALQKKRNLQIRAQAATATPNINSDDLIFRIGDCIDLATELPDASIDILITDPPYGRNFHEDPLWSGAKRSFDDSPENYQATIKNLLSVLESKLKPQAHVYIFCDLRYFHWLGQQVEFILDCEVWRHPLIWDKGSYGSFANIDFGPRHCYDNILFANRGKKKILKHDIDIIRGIVPMEEKIHPDQKPSEVFQNLLDRSAQPGDHILDPFAGAGTIFTASAGRNLRVTAFELDPQWELTLAATISSSLNSKPMIL